MLVGTPLSGGDIVQFDRRPGKTCEELRECVFQK